MAKIFILGSKNRLKIDLRALFFIFERYINADI